MALDKTNNSGRDVAQAIRVMLTTISDIFNLAAVDSAPEIKKSAPKYSIPIDATVYKKRKIVSCVIRSIKLLADLWLRYIFQKLVKQYSLEALVPVGFCPSLQKLGNP